MPEPDICRRERRAKNRADRAAQRAQRSYFRAQRQVSDALAEAATEDALAGTCVDSGGDVDLGCVTGHLAGSAAARRRAEVAREEADDAWEEWSDALEEAEQAADDYCDCLNDAAGDDGPG